MWWITPAIPAPREDCCLACSIELSPDKVEENGMPLLEGGGVLKVDSCTLFIPVLCFLSPKKTLASQANSMFWLCLLEATL